MRNFKLTIEYDGTHFNGWQIQSQGERTIQGEIQNALFKIFKKKINVVASGRTDAGVHALGQVISFKVQTRIPADALVRALRSFLPDDITAIDAENVKASFHAQHSAQSKIYRYTILNRSYPSALTRNYCYCFPYPLNVRRIRNEAQALVGKKDFKSFEAADRERKKHSTVRTVNFVRVFKKADYIFIEIEADGFLYKMIRNIVGTLLDVGSGRIPSGSVAAILKMKDRCQAGQTALAQGLCLLSVKY